MSFVISHVPLIELILLQADNPCIYLKALPSVRGHGGMTFATNSKTCGQHQPLIDDDIISETIESLVIWLFARQSSLYKLSAAFFGEKVSGQSLRSELSNWSESVAHICNNIENLVVQKALWNHMPGTYHSEDLACGIGISSDLQVADFRLFLFWFQVADKSKQQMQTTRNCNSFRSLALGP